VFKTRFKSYSKQFNRLFGKKLVFNTWDDFYLAVLKEFKGKVKSKNDFAKEKTKLKDIISSNNFMEKLLNSTMFFVGGILISRLIDYSRNTSKGISEDLIFGLSIVSVFIILMVVINAVVPDKDNYNFYNTCLNILEENRDEFCKS